MDLMLQQRIDTTRPIRTGREIQSRSAVSIRKLATGKSAPRAADGPSAVVGGTIFRSKLESLNRAIRNAREGTGLITAAEGTLGEVGGLLTQLRGLVTRAANFERYGGGELIDGLQKDADTIIDSIERAARTSRLGRIPIFDGHLGRRAALLPATPSTPITSVRIPDGSEIADGLHFLRLEQTGLVVSVDTTTSAIGEQGQVTNPPGVKTSPTLEGSFFSFTTAGTTFTRDATGLGGVFSPTAGFAGVSNVQFSPLGTEIFFEADDPANPGARQIRRVPRSGGVSTSVGFGVDSQDFDLTAPGVAPGNQRIAFTSPMPFGPTVNSFPSPFGNVRGMAYSSFTGTLFAADGPTATVQELTTAGVPVGLPVPVPFMATIDGLTVDPGTGNFFGIDRANQLAVEFTIAGGVATFVNSFSIAAAVNPGSLTLGNPGSLVINTNTSVTDQTVIQVAQNVTVSFLEMTGALPLRFNATGSVTGTLATGVTLTPGAPSTVNGVTFTLDARGASRSLAGAATSTTAGLDDQLVVSVDGAPGALVTLGTQGSGAAIAAAIQAQVQAAGFPTFTANFIGGRYVLQSGTVGGGSSVAVSAGPNDATAALRLGVAHGGVEGLGAGVLAGSTFNYTVSRAGNDPTGITHDGTNLRISDATFNRIYTFTTAGAQSFGGLVGPSTSPTDIAFHPGRGTLFVANGTDPQYYEVNAATGALVSFHQSPASGNSFPALAVDSVTGNVFLNDVTGDTIYEQNPSGSATGRNILVRNLVTNAVSVVADEAGDQSAPRISANGTTLLYLSAGDLFTRPLLGGPPTQVTFLGTATNPEVSPDGAFATFQSLGTNFVISTSGAGVPTAIGTNPQFHPSLSRVFFEAGGNVFFRNSDGSGVPTQITGVGAIPAGTNYEISPNGNLVAYESGGQILVINSDGSSVTPVQITNQPGIPPGGGSDPTFNRASNQLAFTGADGEIWVRNVDGTVLSTVPAGGFFSTGPTILASNTIIEETFTLEVVGDLDGADVFSVTGSLSGPHAPAVAGIAYTSNPGPGGDGAGMTFTIRQGGQYQVGDRFFVDTTFGANASLDGGPDVAVTPNSLFRAFNNLGHSLDFDIGSPIPGPVRLQPILISHGIEVQVGNDPLRSDKVFYSIEALSARSLGLDGLDVADGFTPRIRDVSLVSGGLVLTESPRVVDDSQVLHQETIEIEFSSATLFNATGSVSGPIAQGLAYTSGVPIQVAGVEFTLSGVGGLGSTLRYDLVTTGRAVDDAIDRVNRIRSDLANAFRQIESAGDADEINKVEMTGGLSEIEDLEFASEIGSLSRNEILRQAEFNVIGQIQFARERVLEVLRRTLVGEA
ncbi:MAG: hypothetical protein HY720_17860 [Planctomycetes bacterium]|nr:hypothetical protein [Planctomycetota bacterium]